MVKKYSSYQVIRIFLSAAATVSSFAGNVFAADEFVGGAIVEEESFVLITTRDSKLSSYAG